MTLLLFLPSVLGTYTPGVLALCLAMMLVLFWYVFHLPEQVTHAPERSRVSFLRERKDAVYENLRDLNFEFKAGKIPEADYVPLRASLEEEAATLLREIERLEGAPTLATVSVSKGVRK